MNFFSQLTGLLENHNIKMTIAENNGIMTVAIYPVAKMDISNAVENLPPLIFSGKPEEIDQEFNKTIKLAMQKTGQIVSNIRLYAEQMKKAEDEAKEKADKKSKSTAKAEKKEDKKEEKKEKKESAPASLFDDANDGGDE